MCLHFSTRSMAKKRISNRCQSKSSAMAKGLVPKMTADKRNAFPRTQLRPKYPPVDISQPLSSATFLSPTSSRFAKTTWHPPLTARTLFAAFPSQCGPDGPSSDIIHEHTPPPSATSGLAFSVRLTYRFSSTRFAELETSVSGVHSIHRRETRL